MKETLKQYLDDFLVLPQAVKLFIYSVVFILIAVCAWQSISNYSLDREVQKLEKMNVQLERAAIKAQAAADHYATQAADEHIRAENLLSQLPKIEKEIKKSDEQIKTQTNNSNSISRDIDALRRNDAKRSTAAELQRKINERYGSNSISNR